MAAVRARAHSTASRERRQHPPVEINLWTNFGVGSLIWGPQHGFPSETADAHSDHTPTGEHSSPLLTPETAPFTTSFHVAVASSDRCMCQSELPEFNSEKTSL